MCTLMIILLGMQLNKSQKDIFLTNLVFCSKYSSHFNKSNMFHAVAKASDTHRSKHKMAQVCEFN